MNSIADMIVIASGLDMLLPEKSSSETTITIVPTVYIATSVTIGEKRVRLISLTYIRSTKNLTAINSKTTRAAANAADPSKL